MSAATLAFCHDKFEWKGYTTDMLSPYFEQAIAHHADADQVSGQTGVIFTFYFLHAGTTSTTDHPFSAGSSLRLVFLLRAGFASVGNAPRASPAPPSPAGRMNQRFDENSASGLAPFCAEEQVFILLRH